MSSHDCADMEGLVTTLQVPNTIGLRNDYMFCSVLRDQEIWFGLPDHFPCERLGLGLLVQG